MTIELINKILAGTIATIIGLITFIVVYLTLGLITEPFMKWIEGEILGGAH